MDENHGDLARIEIAREDRPHALSLNTLDQITAALVAWTFSPSEAQSVRAEEGRPGGLTLVHRKKTFFTKVAASDVGGRYPLIEAHTPHALGPESHIQPLQNELFIALKCSIGV